MNLPIADKYKKIYNWFWSRIIHKKNYHWFWSRIIFQDRKQSADLIFILITLTPDSTFTLFSIFYAENSKIKTHSIFIPFFNTRYSIKLPDVVPTDYNAQVGL